MVVQRQPEGLLIFRGERGSKGHVYLSQLAGDKPFNRKLKPFLPGDFPAIDLKASDLLIVPVFM